MTTDLKNFINHSRKKTGKVSSRMTSAERRRQLIDTAKALFSQKGFNGTTTKEIATRANVTEAMIFRHFNGKDALYEAVITDKSSELCLSDYCLEMTAAAERNDDEKVFRAAAKIILHRYQSKSDVLRILVFGILENRPNVTQRLEDETLPLRRFLADYIRKRQAQGVFFTENAELAVFGFTGMLTHHTMLGEFISKDRKVADDKTAIQLFTGIILDYLRKK